MSEPVAVDRPVEIPAERAVLHGDLAVPENAAGMVVFAHGSGSSRHSPRNRFVAETLRQARLGTLLLDLLTADEEHIDIRTREHRFDIDLLAGRVTAAIDWLAKETPAITAVLARRTRVVRPLRFGVFGASTGAAAALICAARRPNVVAAVVSRGGRPDLAGDMLKQVQAPTLLIVGGEDDVVVELNRRSLAALTCVKRLEIVPGATHLFEERGALDQVARAAADWLIKYLAATPAHT
jgi:putative phosphoribosyl transferase